ncbi:MAG: twin-arginine translocase TatA/TatE family subunit [Candidatus Entotheonellia bacterium]
MFGLGFQELLVVLVLALLFFGGNKLPEVGSALGKAIREFKRATAEPEAIDVKPGATSDLSTGARAARPNPALETNQDHDVHV